MSRRIGAIVIVAVVAFVATAAGVYRVHSGVAGSRVQEAEHEQIVYRGVTACGVERWHIKTGIDADARLVNTKKIVATNVFAMRKLPGPADQNNLPSDSRIRPVESTVYTLTAYLLRYKIESDSDIHLVIADSGGRTMIAEIPAYQCVGSNSPFLSTIRTLRTAFNSHFHPMNFWQRLHLPVTLTGVGFFDFHHGQSGVAPNAIELHPVLRMVAGSFAAGSGAGTVFPQPLPTSPPPVTHLHGKVTVSADVSNSNPARYTHVAVYGHFKVGGKGVSGVPMDAAWHFKTGTGTCSGSTNGNGTASCSRYIGRATSGYTVNIDVTFTYGGSTYRTSTGFTPG